MESEAISTQQLSKFLNKKNFIYVLANNLVVNVL